MADFTGGPGLLAFIATFTMVAVTILLFRSLGKHLRKVRTHPPEGEAPTAAGPADPAGASAASQDDPGDDAAVTDDGSSGRD